MGFLPRFYLERWTVSRTATLDAGTRTDLLKATLTTRLTPMPA
jgi:hypothetical protein